MLKAFEQAREQKVLLGSFLSEIAFPNILRIYRQCGVGFVMIDCEHGSFDYSQVAALCAVGNAIGLPVLVRVPSVTREPVQKMLDAGADGVLAPMVNTPAQALALVRLAKYAPLGNRGASLMRPHSDYAPGALPAYLQKANARTMVFVQIETREGLENLAEIAAVEGLDGLFLGPNDLSIDLGTPGDFDTPAMRAAVSATVGVCRQSGKLSGMISSKMPYLRWCRQMGMQLFSCDSEVGLLAAQARRMVSDFDSVAL